MQAGSIHTKSQAFALPAHHEAVQSQAEELAARFADHHRDVRLHPFDHGELYPDLWQEVSRRGWPGLLVPAEYGGADGGLLAYVVIMEALGASNLVLWMPVLSAAIGHAIAQAGPDPARASGRLRMSSVS